MTPRTNRSAARVHRNQHQRASCAASARASLFAMALLSLGMFTAARSPASAQPAVLGAVTPNPVAQRAWMTVGQRRFAITLADTTAARAFAAAMPLSLDMAELNGNEKHADLVLPLPVSPSVPGTIRNGDLLLYGAKTVVVFYATLDSRYTYTRLGRVDDPTALAQALGNQGARVTFSLK